MSTQMLCLHSGNTICEQRLKHSHCSSTLQLCLNGFSLLNVQYSVYIFLRCATVAVCMCECMCVNSEPQTYCMCWQACSHLHERCLGSLHVLCIAELAQRLSFGLLIPFYSTGIMCYSNPNPIWGVWRWHEDDVRARTRGEAENHMPTQSHNSP